MTAWCQTGCERLWQNSIGYDCYCSVFQETASSPNSNLTPDCFSVLQTMQYRLLLLLLLPLTGCHRRFGCANAFRWKMRIALIRMGQRYVLRHPKHRCLLRVHLYAYLDRYAHCVCVCVWECFEGKQIGAHMWKSLCISRSKSEAFVSSKTIILIKLNESKSHLIETERVPNAAQQKPFQLAKSIPSHSLSHNRLDVLLPFVLILLFLVTIWDPDVFAAQRNDLSETCAHKWQNSQWLKYERSKLPTLKWSACTFGAFSIASHFSMESTVLDDKSVIIANSWNH